MWKILIEISFEFEFFDNDILRYTPRIGAGWPVGFPGWSEFGAGFWGGLRLLGRTRPNSRRGGLRRVVTREPAQRLH